MAKKNISPDGFDVKMGLLDYLNSDYFYNNHALTIYMRFLGDSQKESTKGLGKLNLKQLSDITKISHKQTFEAMQNLEEIKFVDFKLIPNKGILTEKGYNVFSKKENLDDKINIFLNSNENKDAYDLALDFFNSINIGDFKNYTDLLFMPKMNFNYTINKYTDKTKKKVSFSSEVYIIVAYFVKLKSENNELWKNPTEKWLMANKMTAARMLKQYRMTLSERNSNDIIDLMKKMINVCFADPYHYSRANSFGWIEANEMEFMELANKVSKVKEKINNNEKMKVLTFKIIKYMDMKLQLKLNYSQRFIAPFYFYDIISNYPNNLIVDAINDISNNYYDKSNINLKKIIGDIRKSLKKVKVRKN